MRSKIGFVKAGSYLTLESASIIYGMYARSSRDHQRITLRNVKISTHHKHEFTCVAQLCESCVINAKGCGFDSQGTHVLIKCIPKSSGKCINVMCLLFRWLWRSLIKHNSIPLVYRRWDIILYSSWHDCGFVSWVGINRRSTKINEAVSECWIMINTILYQKHHKQWVKRVQCVDLLKSIFSIWKYHSSDHVSAGSAIRTYVCGEFKSRGAHD